MCEHVCAPCVYELVGILFPVCVCMCMWRLEVNEDVFLTLFYYSFVSTGILPAGMSVCHVHSSTLRGHRCASGSLKLELQTVVSYYVSAGTQT